LILNQKGQKLSKRDGVTSIWDFKDMGFVAEAIANYMTLLGWTPPDSTREIFTLPEAAAEFDLDRVNKAGAKFDWDKLDWINSQYLHRLEAEELVELLIPYWQEAGYEFDPERDRAWLVQLTQIVAPSLKRLPDAVAESRLLFGEAIAFNDKGLAQLKQNGVAEVLQAVVEQIDSVAEFTEAEAKTIINTVTKAQNVKKGLVMKSLRAGLTGELQGPDLIQSWVLLHQRGIDKLRLQQALSQI
ncbi:MAG: glutamate--tRNA ligase family protein, partial [Cyanobacteriota bacterium]|nr:glutamate--tRNA ligase family protein [Cyanobacteriota bacterium]